MVDYSKIKTPCYLINLKKFQDNAEWIRNCFASQMKGYFPVIGYSVKTNHNVELLKTAHKMGMYAEVVSDDEYQLALFCGYHPWQIIFNGPQKSQDFLLFSLKNQSIVNLDNFQELKVLCNNIRDLRETELNIGLRVNFDLEKKCAGETTAGTEVSRFGFCVENGDFGKAVEECKKLKIPVRGLHMHYSSKTRSLAIFRELAAEARWLIKQYCLADTISYIDMGGGFFLGEQKNSKGKPSMTDYAKCICRELEEVLDFQKTQLIIEPGASLLATVVDYFSKIINQRNIRKSSVLTIDGSFLHINPFLADREPILELLYNRETIREKIPEQMICGATCMENDRLLKIENKEKLMPGDGVLCHCVGAYTMGLNHCFINLPPYIYLIEQDSVKLIRDRKENYMKVI